jgi:hypothetical protein
MLDLFIPALRTLNQLLTAGIAITAFSLLLYALTFNLRDRVARSFATILACVVIVFVCDTIGSTVSDPASQALWLSLQWIGIIFLPSAYLHFSDALLTTTGRPSRGRRRNIIRLTYVISVLFLLALVRGWLIDSVIESGQSTLLLKPLPLTWVFVAYYFVGMGWALVNFWRAWRRSVTQTGKRRMLYLLAGAAAPSLGSFPYMLFGSQIVVSFPNIFWVIVTLSNVLVGVLLVVMAYTVAFFGVSWPDRVVKRRLFKWLMRGPAAAFIVLAVTTLVRRIGLSFGEPYSSMVPIAMVGTLILFEFFVTLAAPVWERWLFYGRDRATLNLLQTLEERLLTSGDLKQFLEAILVAVCERLQVTKAFVVALGPSGQEMLVSVGANTVFDEAFSIPLEVTRNTFSPQTIRVGDHWILPLYSAYEEEHVLIGLLGVEQLAERNFDEEQLEALRLLGQRATLALEDQLRQQKVFTSLESLTPQVELIQRLRAASRYSSVDVLTNPEFDLDQSDMVMWVKDALNHYWGGPKLTSSPLMRLHIVQRALNEHKDNPANALRAILRQAVERVRPEGERRFTAEWILYNILEMKFFEGKKVREVAMRLAMSEADLYRKQRVAIESVANAILEMEMKVEEEPGENKIKISAF